MSSFRDLFHGNLICYNALTTLDFFIKLLSKNILFLFKGIGQ